MADEIVNTGADAAEDTSNTGSDTNDKTAETGGTTPEEVASVLRGSGIKLPEQGKTEVLNDEEAEDESDTGSKDTDDSDEIANAEVKPSEAANDKPATSAKIGNDGGAKGDNQPLAPDTPDFSFTVQDSEGVTFKIAPGDSIEDVLEDFSPKNNGQIISILEQLREAKDNQKNYDAEQATKAEQATQDAQVAAIQQEWDREIKTLIADKRLPTTADGKNSKQVEEIYTFMGEENNRRMQEGRPTINSFEDALDKYENTKAREAKVTQAKEAKETARKNGSLVGGSSAPATSGTPVYRSGTARNANQAIKALGLL